VSLIFLGKAVKRRSLYRRRTLITSGVTRAVPGKILVILQHLNFPLLQTPNSKAVLTEATYLHSNVGKAVERRSLYRRRTLMTSGITKAVPGKNTFTL